MSLRPQPLEAIPEQTARVAHAAFPKGNPYLTLRDHLGTIFQDEDFATLCPAWGSPGRIYMKLSVDSLHQCEGFVLFCQTFSEDLSRGVSFS